MIVASIDIGTNTVLLLIAEVDSKTGKIIPLRNEYRMPRIGQGTKNSRVIAFEKINLLFSILVEYDRIIRDCNCDKVILTGTNAFRMAVNTPFIAKEIKKVFGFDLNVISGEEEAEFAYLGAISGFEDSIHSMVIDIGGSSTEIIVGERNKIIFKRSLQLGSVSATEQFLLHSPPLRSEIEKFSTEIKKAISIIDPKEVPEQVLAIAGTVTTLACMKLELRNFEEVLVNNCKINIQEIRKIIAELICLKPPEINEKYGQVMTGREDIIFAGILILYQFMESFRIESIKVSTRGIRYGAIVHYIKNLN